MVNKAVVITVISVLILGSAIIFVFQSYESGLGPGSSSSSTSSTSSSSGGDNGDSSSESSSSSSGGGGGGGGSGGGAGGSTSTSSTSSTSSSSTSSTSSSSSSGGGCTISTESIDYSINNFKEIINCIDYNPPGNCVNLSALCSVEIHNTDSEAGDGIFTVKYNLIEKSTNDLINTRTFTGTIPPGGFKVFEPTFLVANPAGVSEDLSCKLSIESTPTKEVCI